MTVLRASSLAAVTIFVWSTRLNFSSCVIFRTAWRASTTSCSTRRASVSLLMTAIRALPVGGHRGAEPVHSPFDVERGLHPLERQPQLDQRDRDGRPHADEDGAGVEDARHAGDV